MIVVAVSECFFSIACSINSRKINPAYQLRNRKKKRMKERYAITGAMNALIDFILRNIRGKRERYRQKEKKCDSDIY